MRYRRTKIASVGIMLLAASLASLGQQAAAVPNPVATTEAEYAAYGRVFSDPQGCLAHDTDGDGVNDVVPPNVSPWAKGNMCFDQFITYEEMITGARMLARLYPRFLQVIRLDQAYDNPNLQSAGIPREFVVEDGQVKAIDRDRRPLYMLKVTDSESPVPEPERLHFAYAASIHGIERAGAEGAIRAMEDMVTWAATDPGQPLIETPTDRPVPTAGDALQRSVVYFIFPNPDGWARGQVAPAELEDGSPNVNYRPGAYYQRYNGNGMDLNRDWPGVGYTYRPYTPGSEPETKAYMDVLRKIRGTISPNNPVGQRFAGAIDLHGQIADVAYSFTLLGAGQRDFRKNASTVDQGLRTWADQTSRLAWSPYIGTIFPAADQWGTVIDTLGYQVSGAHADWMENEQIGLGAVGIDNEMSLSHIAPNNVYDPINEQMHVDGNKGLIYSQMASMLTEPAYRYEPTGKLGYVHNPVRIENGGTSRPENPGLPAQNDIDVILPCQSEGPQNVGAAVPCGDGTFVMEGTAMNLEFDVFGPSRGIWNGGITATMTNTNATGISLGSLSRVSLQRFDEDSQTWENVATSFVQAGSPDVYLPAGQIVTANDPLPGRWRVRVSAGGAGPFRMKVDFNPVTAEASPGQAAFSASSMDFFADLNRYIPEQDDRAEAVTIEQIIADPAVLDRFDSLVVVNTIGNRAFLTDAENGLGLTDEQATAYFAALRSFAEGGGNLVLTDGALDVARQVGLVPEDSVRSGNAGQGRGLAARYQFNVSGRGNVCNVDPLLAEVCLPGTAGGSTRVAVEPTPLGYSPDGTLDTGVDAGAPVARMQQWWIDRNTWQEGCGKENPVECTSSTFLGAGAGETALGERKLGEGVVRILGALFPDPNFAPGGVRDMRFGVDSYALSFSAWQMFLNVVDYQRPVSGGEPDLVVSDLTVASKVFDGHTAVITVTVANDGDADAGPSSTEVLLDGDEVIGTAPTPAMPAGGSSEVTMPWPVNGVKGEHHLQARADHLDDVAEANEANNQATRTVQVKGNKVENGSFEQDRADGSGPEGWSASESEAGQATWSDDGTDGSRAVSITGTGGDAGAGGAPAWTSDPIEVTPGEVYDLVASVQLDDVSSAPAVGLTYLDASGELLETVTVLAAPSSTDGFTELKRPVTIPAGVVQVRVVLTGFAGTDSATAGRVTFDDVGLYGG